MLFKLHKLRPFGQKTRIVGENMFLEEARQFEPLFLAIYSAEEPVRSVYQTNPISH
jgi:hypothetical protein